MEIRIADEKDVDSLFRLNELFNGIGATTKELLLDSILNNMQETVFIADNGNRVLGFCCVQLLKSICYSTSYAEITELFVLEEHRRQGVATALMKYAEKYFKDQNIREYQLLTGKHNKAAQAFYEKNGYKRLEEVMYRKII